MSDFSPKTIPENIRFDANGLELHALRHGTPGKPTVVLLHGFMDHAHAWDEVAARLAPDYDVIALDFRGFGDSGWEPGGAYHFAAYQVDVAALWRRFDLEDAFLVGHSMGGNVGSQWAGLYPKRVAKLVLVEGFGPPVREIEEGPRRMRRWIEGLLMDRQHPRAMLNIDEAAARLQENNPYLADDRARELAEKGTREVGDGLVWKFDPAHRLPNPHPYREDEFAVYWSAIEAPTLALHGEHGPLPFEAIEHRYKHIRTLERDIIAGAAHGIHIEQPGALAERILKFLKEGSR